MKIEEYLSEGCENALSMADLSLILNVDKRTVRMMILSARIDGLPICSTCQGSRHGYFMPRNVDETRINLRDQNITSGFVFTNTCSPKKNPENLGKSRKIPVIPT